MGEFFGLFFYGFDDFWVGVVDVYNIDIICKVVEDVFVNVIDFYIFIVFDDYWEVFWILGCYGKVFEVFFNNFFSFGFGEFFNVWFNYYVYYWRNVVFFLYKFVFINEYF